MPILIAAVLAAMVTFYVKTQPDLASTTSDNELIQSATETEMVSEIEPSPEIRSFNSAVSMSSPLPRAASSNESLAIPIAEPISTSVEGTSPVLIATAAAEQDFTPWLSPLALDTYIRQLNGGFEQSFWQRGHRITAVEGRLHQGAHEFRIVFNPIPELNQRQWQYRANQTRESFLQSSLELESEGYRIVQSQAFSLSDGRLRYQGVWQKMVGAQSVANRDSLRSENSSQIRVLDVNRPNFR
tara:strand:+ start:763 stop:1488 length:726 start_codon:yes stop_codon:yes gene_type:complete